jgi:hypothetical protein
MLTDPDSTLLKTASRFRSVMREKDDESPAEGFAVLSDEQSAKRTEASMHNAIFVFIRKGDHRRGPLVKIK